MSAPSVKLVEPPDEGEVLAKYAALQKRHRADINDHKDHRDKFSPHQNEKPRRVKKRKNEKKDRMDRVAGRNHQQGANDQNGGKNIKGNR